MKVNITINYDHDAENPNDQDGSWRLISFGRRHNNYQDPDELFDYDYETRTITPREDELKEKLENGLAFILSYYEHGNCVWSLQGTGPQCQFDSVGIAGLLVWENKEEDMGSKTYQDREKDAKFHLEYYTNWANGNCYYVDIVGEDGEDILSCSGFVGEDAVVEMIKDSLDHDDEILEVTGKANWIADYNTLIPEKPDVTV